MRGRLRQAWRQWLGQRGERLAERHLRRRGHRVLARNFRCAAGEIDLVTLDGGTIVFVEVKTRRGSLLAEPDQAVNPAKRARLVRAARAYLGLHSGQGRPCRFDVVWIVQDGPGRPNIQHIPDAFGATC